MQYMGVLSIKEPRPTIGVLPYAYVCSTSCKIRGRATTKSEKIVRSMIQQSTSGKKYCPLYRVYVVLRREEAYLCRGAAPRNRFDRSTEDGARSTCTETSHDSESRPSSPPPPPCCIMNESGSTPAHCSRSGGTPSPRLLSMRSVQRFCCASSPAAAAARTPPPGLAAAVAARVHRSTAETVAIMATRRTVVEDCFFCCLGWPLLQEGDGEEAAGSEGRVLGAGLAGTAAAPAAGSWKNRPWEAEGGGVALFVLLLPPPPPLTPKISSLLVAERLRRCWPLETRGERPLGVIMLLLAAAVSAVSLVLLLVCLSRTSRSQKGKVEAGVDWSVNLALGDWLKRSERRGR